MRICYIADAQSIHTQRLVNHFARQGHEIHLISSRFTDGYEASIHMHPLTRLLPVTWSPFKSINGLWWLYEVRKLVRKIAPHILDAHFLPVSGYLGCASGFHPFVMSVWGSDILLLPKSSFFNRWATKFVLKKADFVTCISRFLYDALSEYTSLSKVRMIPFGVDSETFKPRGEKQASSLKTIGIIKSLDPVYGIEYLIKAIPLIIKDFQDLKVLIIGDGDETPYRRLSKELKVEKHIEFISGVPHRDVPGYLAKMDIFVMPSLSESFGVAALEAQAMEIPVVASRVGGIPEVVKDGISGLLVEPGNPPAIADAVRKLLTDDFLREQMGRKGRELAIKNYEWKELMKERENLYREISGFS